MNKNVKKYLNPKQTVYFPALSSGESKRWLQQPERFKLKNGMTPRFYSDTWPDNYRHPYFLISAGHNYKVENFRETLGLEDSLVFGDSGGFQLSTGKLKWKGNNKKELRGKILTWLENNSDLAANIDLPPRGVYANRLEEALEGSVENFKYFDKHRVGKTMMLNVIQGDNVGEIHKWYAGVKDFEFDGWCLGGVRDIINLIYKMAFMLENGEFEKKRNRLFHALGVSRIDCFFIIACMQDAINEKYGNDIVFSLDSSSANLYSIYGDILLTFDLSRMSYTKVNITNKREVEYDKTAPVPNLFKDTPPFLDKVKLEDLYNWSQDSKTVMTLYNLEMLLQAWRLSNQIVSYSKDFINSTFISDYTTILKSIYEIVGSDNPLQVFYSYKPLYHKYSSFKNTQDNKIANKFFQYK